jgi:hypothetical protein
VPGAHPAACLGHDPRIWVVGSGYASSLFQAITQAQAAVLRQHRYCPATPSRCRGLIVFLLMR